MQRLHPFVTLALVLFISACGGKNSGPKKIQPCGDGDIDQNETCDTAIPAGLPGACPEECPDSGDACGQFELQGQPGQCNVECVQVEPTCGEIDGCCPTACDEQDDDDCSTSGGTCGDGQLDLGENCDPGIPSGRNGACECEEPTSSCETITNVGDASRCVLTCVTQQIDSCISGDGCCPNGCSSANDNDCSATCGNNVIEGNETCDGNCPSSCSDGDACTDDIRTGTQSNCNVECSFQSITMCISNDGCCPNGCTTSNDSDCAATCGNNVIEGAETCDGNCPSSCNDNNACTADTRTGSASSCNVVCDYDPITACVDNDGCCPSTCNSANDNDCSATCGNNIVEANETCDGNCPSPADCTDNNACTLNSFQGSAANCTAECIVSNITSCTSNDGCCPSNCDANRDNDCSSVCGNNVIEPGENCDGNCPSSCTSGNACIDSVLVGTVAACTAECVDTVINSCVDNDGCCPSTCDFQSDNDCVCVADTCNSLGYACGTIVDDGCGGGGEVCGSCNTGETCVNFACVDNFDVGAACTSDADCDGGLGTCVDEANFAWTGGYCTRFCSSDSDCGAANHCDSTGICVQDCGSDADCRADYGCYDFDGDSTPECAPLGSGTGAVGDPCTSYADCSGGESGFCSPENDTFLGGFCTQLCAIDADCPVGNHCLDSGACVPDCTDANDCRGTGYDCYDADGDSSLECFSFANGPGAVGAACSGLWDCGGGEFGGCAQDADGWPGGYCTVLCGANEGTCASGSTCDTVNGDYCLDDCQNTNQCRTDYSCTDPGIGTTHCYPI